MKSVLFLACILSVAADQTPIDQVVTLIKGLATTIENDGKAEQATYDKYACWVEDTLARKASDISSAKELIEELNDSIKKGKAEIASHGAEIAALKKDIAGNNAAQKEANGLRDKQHAEYAGDRAESEQCIGAMEVAIKVLTGAGTKKAGFLQQVEEAQLMSIAGGVRMVLANHRAQSVVSESDLDLVKAFVQNPAASIKGMSAAQISQNPFGDYAPQSSQIQGILKGMYDAFATDLEKDNAEEAKQQKGHEELMATKKQELETLEATLQKQESDEATKTKKLAEDEVSRDDTTAQLAADETFFEDTKDAAKNKAGQWSTRTQLRTEELAGMEGAIQILEGGSKTLTEAQTTFLQLKTVHTHQNMAYGALKAMAAKYRSSSLAKLVTVMQTGGHFDKVMVMIDEMVALLRKEGQSDIAHRDRCENSENANANAKADANSAIDSTNKKIGRLGRAKGDADKELSAVKDEIVASEADLAKMLKMRNEDHDEFTRALKMDSEAVSLIGMAIVRMSKYYKENKINVGLVQAPEYAQDADKAPAADFSGANKRQGESTGIVAILEMIKEDLQKEMKEGRADEAKSQADYDKQSGAAQDALDAQEEKKVNTEKAITGLEENIADAEQFKKDKQGDLGAEEDMEKSLLTDCDWVKTNFDSRAKARATELDGLVEAKNFLAGVESGNAVLAP